MSVIDDINNTFAAQKAAGYPGGSQQPQGGSTTTVPQPQQPVTPAPAPQSQQLSFVDLYKKFNTYNPPTQEQVAEQERKQKRDTLFAKLGNGFNAFQQAYAAARGTKPLTQDTDYVGKTRDRYEKLTKERDALSREYANGMLRAAQMDESLKQQAITNQLAQQRQDRLDRETRIKEEKASAYQQYQASVAAKNQEQAAYWHAKWQALESGKSADEALKEARAAQAHAAARLANVRADNGGFASTANGGVGGYVVTEEKTDSRGRKTTSRKERRPTTGTQKKANPMGGSNSSNKKPNPMSN